MNYNAGQPAIIGISSPSRSYATCGKLTVLEHLLIVQLTSMTMTLDISSDIRNISLLFKRTHRYRGLISSTHQKCAELLLQSGKLYTIAVSKIPYMWPRCVILER
jgi:hypothetical protein